MPKRTRSSGIYKTLKRPIGPYSTGVWIVIGVSGIGLALLIRAKLRSNKQANERPANTLTEPSTTIALPGRAGSTGAIFAPPPDIVFVDNRQGNGLADGGGLGQGTCPEGNVQTDGGQCVPQAVYDALVQKGFLS